MARQKRKVSGTGIYHVLIKGINQQRIFEQVEDYKQFLDYLYEVKKLSGLVLYAYCLMGNHVHLLLKEGEEPLSMVFRRLGTRYVHWFNHKYDRSGHLFQDRFRSEPVETDEYFVTVLIYIYNNPVKAGLCSIAGNYEWSSRRFLNNKSGRDGLIDMSELTAVVPVKTIMQKEQELSHDEKPLEPMAGRRNIYADKDIVLMVRQFSGAKNTSEFQKMPLDEQQTLIKKLRSERVPIRQIARVTGISKGVLERWGRM